jgi:hypothetical protein
MIKYNMFIGIFRFENITLWSLMYTLQDLYWLFVTRTYKHFITLCLMPCWGAESGVARGGDICLKRKNVGRWKTFEDFVIKWHTSIKMKFYWRYWFVPSDSSFYWGRRGSDRMVVGFTTTNTISAYHH